MKTSEIGTGSADGACGTEIVIVTRSSVLLIPSAGI